EALTDAVRATGTRVLDRHTDPDHNRTVLTVAGEPLALQDALFDLAAESLERIDLRRHRGAHPRIGALDVVPLVALTPDDMPLARPSWPGTCGFPRAPWPTRGPSPRACARPAGGRRACARWASTCPSGARPRCR